MKNNEKYKSWKLIPFTTLHCYSTPHCIPCVTILKAFTCYIVKFGFFLVLPYVCLCFYVSHHIYLQPHSKILSCTCAICMLWTHHLKDSLQQTNICIKTPKLMWNIIRIRIFSFPNSKQKHFKNQRSAKKCAHFSNLVVWDVMWLENIYIAITVKIRQRQKRVVEKFFLKSDLAVFITKNASIVVKN